MERKIVDSSPEGLGKGFDKSNGFNLEPLGSNMRFGIWNRPEWMSWF